MPPPCFRLSGGPSWRSLGPTRSIAPRQPRGGSLRCCALAGLSPSGPSLPARVPLARNGGRRRRTWREAQRLLFSQCTPPCPLLNYPGASRWTGVSPMAVKTIVRFERSAKNIAKMRAFSARCFRREFSDPGVPGNGYSEIRVGPRGRGAGGRIDPRARKRNWPRSYILSDRLLPVKWTPTPSGGAQVVSTVEVPGIRGSLIGVDPSRKPTTGREPRASRSRPTGRQPPPARRK